MSNMEKVVWALFGLMGALAGMDLLLSIESAPECIVAAAPLGLVSVFCVRKTKPRILLERIRKADEQMQAVGAFLLLAWVAASAYLKLFDTSVFLAGLLWASLLRYRHGAPCWEGFLDFGENSKAL